MANNNNIWSSREWMYNRIDEVTGDMFAQFAAGVDEFMAVASNQPIAQSNRGKFYCPCYSCQNAKFLMGRKIWSHIYTRGFMPNYYVWYNHGESLNVDLGDMNHASDSNIAENVYHYEDRYVEMVNHAFHSTTTFDKENNDEGYQNVEEPNKEAKFFYDMLEAAKYPLYDGCHDGQSRLSLAARFMNIKANYNIPEKCMDSWAEFFSEYLLDGNQSTSSYYETEKLMRNMGLPFYTIDVCIENCMFFWKEDERLDKCKFCNNERWKPSEGRTKIPYSRMWYLPVADRLKRLYQSEQTAAPMRWHAEHDSQELHICD